MTQSDNEPPRHLYGKQTALAVENFPVSGSPMPAGFIHALGLVKYATARVNQSLGAVDGDIADAIAEAALAVSRGDYDAHFPVDVYQTGSGTSSNMNANEVIASIAAGASGKTVHPNDHVNRSQSSNDVIPTTLHVAAVLALQNSLYPAIEHLLDVSRQQAEANQHVVKTGRTHLMDAMPVTAAQEIGGWIAQVDEARHGIVVSARRVEGLAIGGTAVGTGINAPADFGQRVCDILSNHTGIAFHPSPNRFAAMSSQDAVVSLSGQLKVLAVALMKISNDLRWMNSGPNNGLGEIQLPELQPGSSIMPGKVNPVIPESVAQVAARVIGNDTTITVAGQSGNFQLNVMLPVVADTLLQSITLLSRACQLLADKCIAGLTYNSDYLAHQAGLNPVLITALNAQLGYDAGAAIAKRAMKEKRPLREVAAEMTELSAAQLDELLDPIRLTSPEPADA